VNDSAPESVFQILLAEDAPDQSLLLSALLQKLGPFNVTLVQDGLQALDLARRDSFDLILTDLNLPGIDGFELTRALKKEFPRLPVLAATGYTDSSYVAGAYRAGVDALMTKPVDPEDLEARLRELLPRWRSAGERPPSVIAVGARPGDVELGCGASLAAHQAAGHDVLVVVLGAGETDDRIAARARKAAEELGVRLISADGSPAQATPEQRHALLARLIGEMEPTWAYLPSGSDRDPARRAVHQVADGATRGVATVLAYATPTTRLDFAPSVYRDVGRWMDAKLAALAHHQAGHAPDPGLSPAFALAHARYWGRFKGFAAVEPFELLGSTDAGPSREEVPEATSHPAETMPAKGATTPEAIAPPETASRPAPAPAAPPLPAPTPPVPTPMPEQAARPEPSDPPSPTRRPPPPPMMPTRGGASPRRPGHTE
jgi:CheY-like chemotaxis protein/LmbE family N-acetylglucosaminyl deacetylase